MSQSEREKEFLKRLKATFKIEAEELIKTISSGLLELEKDPTENKQEQILQTIYHQAHSLKGAARAVDLISIETICQSLENIFKEFKSQGIPSSPQLFDTLHRTMDIIDMQISSAEEIDISGILHELAMIPSGEFMAKPGPDIKPPGGKRFTRQGYLSSLTETEKSRESTVDMIRVPIAKLDHLLRQAEEIIPIKLAIHSRITELHELILAFEDLKKKQAYAAPLLKSLQKNLHNGMNKEKNIREYVDYSNTQTREILANLNRTYKALQLNHRILTGMVDNHLEELRKTLMLPFSTLIESFPRMIRDLARQKGKEIELVIKGQEIEIEKRILEEMKSPLIHLVRNAVDHGIETPVLRKKKKKPIRGLITVIIRQQEGNKVEITVSDDGIGIDPEKVKHRALSTDIATIEDLERLSEQKILSLIFNAEFSTSPIVTDLSGRGLGLAIVREKVEHLGGRITLESTWGQGTSFRIILQATLASFRGILVESSTRKFIIPTLYMEQLLHLNPQSVKTHRGRSTIKIDNYLIPYAGLANVLGLSVPGYTATSSQTILVAVLAAGDKKVAFQVDDVLEEKEVLVKDLGPLLSRVKNISGAAILSSGEVVPIINVNDLIKSALSEVFTRTTSRKS